jgi:hypothetical protein
MDDDTQKEPTAGQTIEPTRVPGTQTLPDAPTEQLGGMPSSDTTDNSPWRFSESSEPQTAPDSPTANMTTDGIEWTASEYIAHDKNNSWYLLLAGGSIVLVAIVYLFTRDIFASIAVFIACGALGFIGARKPQTKQYRIDSQGVVVNKRGYLFSDFRSFAVVDEGSINSIWLKPLKRFAAPVVMYYSPDDEEKITTILAVYLPNEQRELDPIDRLSKRLRF